METETRRQHEKFRPCLKGWDKDGSPDNKKKNISVALPQRGRISAYLLPPCASVAPSSRVGCVVELQFVYVSGQGTNRAMLFPSSD